jgi:hypothetical protein
MLKRSPLRCRLADQEPGAEAAVTAAGSVVTSRFAPLGRLPGSVALCGRQPWRIRFLARGMPLWACVAMA